MLQGVMDVDYPERELVRKSRHGDIEAFEDLIKQYERKIFNMALSMTQNYDDAGDIAQEVCIKIFKNIRKFKEDSSFSTWVYRITSNTCIDAIRRKKRTLPLTVQTGNGDEEYEIPVEDSNNLPDKVFEKNETRDAIKKCIMELAPEYRIIIILRDVNGYSYDEISGILSINMGTVKSRLNRARNLLKDKLKMREPFSNSSV